MSGAPSASSGAASRDTIIALRSAFILGSSLVATWSVALVVRLFLPRHLGPALFGAFNFADSFAATCFIVLGLGMETYIQKEIPVRPAHASDFFGGVTLVRAVLGLAVFAVAFAILRVTHRPAHVQRAVLVFGVAQLLVATNGNLSALLHASRNVGGLAIVNVVSKVLWGAAVGAALALALPIEALAAAFLASESLRAVVLFRLARAHLALCMRVDLGAARAAMREGLPFYVNAIAITAYAKVDVSILTFLSSDAEVGYYSSAGNFAGLAMLISPLLGSVLMPLLSRAAARSEDELIAILRRAIEAILQLAIPVSLMISVGADVWIKYVFGPKFVPATPALVVLGPMFVLTYLAMIGGTSLILLKRPWTVTTISLVGLVINPLLNLLVVPLTLRAFGPGGGGIGAASVSVLTEALVTASFLRVLGLRVFDRRSAWTLGKSLAAAACVVLLDGALRPLGPARLALDALAYLVVVVATGAVRVAEVKGVLAQMLQRGRARAAAS